MNLDTPLTPPTSPAVRPAHSGPSRHRRRPRGSFRLLWAASAVLQAWSSLAGAADPALPTPCSGGACGAGGSLPFVGAGQIGHGGAPVIDGNTMTVHQLSQQAILNWQDFNIGAGKAVVFDQPEATASTLNRVWGPDASTIAGQLRANGQVYLINQNGVLFAEGARVDVGGLVASTLDVKDAIYLGGLLTANAGVLGNANDLPAVFEQGALPAGEVEIRPGAVLATAHGGRIMLLAPTVTNRGTISTPDGQAILGAGHTVYLAASSDPGLRGLLIEVDAAGLPHSAASNHGSITAERGNITLAGLMVNQAGRLTATTSVSANGSIHLSAGDVSRGTGFYSFKEPGSHRLLPNQGGSLTLSAGSLTQVVADATDTKTINDTQAFLPSAVSLVGKTIRLEGDAAVVAPGGSVHALAADNPYLRFSERDLQKSALVPPDGSRIYLDSGSRIDVAGLREVQLSAERNLVEVELRSNELQDAPLQRDGFLRGKTVTVDLRKGTPLADLAPYRDNLGRGIAEKLTRGGDITLDSGGDVIARAGSILDVSGGTLQYQPGYDRSTTLLGSDGRLYDIADAPIDVRYVGFADGYTFTSGKWGTTTAVATPRPVLQGYTEGKSAGTLAVSTPWAALQGTLRGQASAGPLQRSAAELPRGGTLVIGEASQEIHGERSDFRARHVVLGQGVPALPLGFGANDPVPEEWRQSLQLSTDLVRQGGFSDLHLYSNDDVALQAGTHLQLAPGGAFSAVAWRDIDIAGNIGILSGSIRLDSTRGGSVRLAPGAWMDVRGGWVNNSPLIFATADNAPLLLDGGSVALEAQRDVSLGAGSRIDVSGGGWVDGGNALTPGKGGSIRLASASVDAGGTLLGRVELQGELLGYGLFDGGTLAITAASVRIGGMPTGAAGELWLDPARFGQGGFAAYSLTGVNGLEIAAGTQIRPRMQNWIPDASYLIRPSGTAVSAFSRAGLLDDLFRNPVSLALAATSIRSQRGDLTLGTGAAIVTDPGATVSLAANGSLRVHGTIDAPAGRIRLEVAPGVVVGADDDATLQGFDPNQQLLLGSGARLLAGSVAQIRRDSADGLRKGRMLDGGSVALNAYKGSLILEAGSLIDVSGTRGEIDQFTPSGVQTLALAGAGGAISLRAREGLAIHGSLLGRAADVPGAAAGSLTLGLDLYQRTDNPNALLTGTPRAYPTQDRVLTLTSAPADGLPATPANGTARVSTQQIQAGGFDRIELRSTDVIAIDGAVDLGARRSLVLDAQVLRGNPGATASLHAAYVALGNADGARQPGGGQWLPVRNPAGGDAVLHAHAQLLDIRGHSVLDGFARTHYHSDGDIRLAYSVTGAATDFTGSLRTAGDLVFQADQLYPATRTQFTLNPEGAYVPGVVTFLSNGGAVPDTPLSAGGRLTVNASTIDQGGVVRAPLGQIAFNAGERVTLRDGSLTSVSAEGALIPYGSVQNGSTWVYQIDPNTSALVSAPPAKQLSLNAPTVDIQAGAAADLSGGGDLYAYEFVAGPGGSQDVLDGRYTAAILPALGARTAPSAFAPLDHQYQAGSGVDVGDSVYLSGVPGLADGYYVLLPARYALLPGAYALSVVQGVQDLPLPALSAAQGYQDLPLGTAFAQMDGSTIVAGRTAVAGTDIVASRTTLFHVTPGSVVRTQSQYSDSYSNAFFHDAAANGGTAVPRLAADAGQLQLAATQALTLNGRIGFGAAAFDIGKDEEERDVTRTGRGGEASIEAPAISLVDRPGAGDGTLQLQTSKLNELGAQSLIIGGRRSTTAAGDQLLVSAGRVELRNSAAAALAAPEIILAATQALVVRAGSAIQSQGALDGAAAALSVEGDGALLRVAEAPQPVFSRILADPSAPLLGTLTVEDQARIASGGSVILDAAADSRIGAARIDAHALALSSSRVGIGDAPEGAPAAGLKLTSSLLAGLASLTDLTLRSYGAIDLYGDLALGGTDAQGRPLLHSLHLDGWGLVGHGAGDKLLQAGTISLTNQGQAACAAACAGDGSGSLTLRALGGEQTADAGRLFLGAGDKRVSGFSGVLLQAQGDIAATGDGRLDLAGAGDLRLQSVRLGTATGADQSIANAGGGVDISSGTTGPVPELAEAGIGGRLAISGTRIRHGGTISVRAGELTLHATGTQPGDGVTLLAGSRIDASGVEKTLGGVSAYAAAGKVGLASAQGDVDIQAEAGELAAAVVDLSGAPATTAGGGSDAGTLSIQAAQGQVSLAGDLRAGADSGRHQGAFELDVGSLGPDGWAALNPALAAGGFTRSVEARVRSGDVLIGAADSVRAHQFRLSADGGAIVLAGSIDARGADGGRIDLYARNDLTLASGASLRADATAAESQGGQGGRITLGTAAGTLDLQGGSRIAVGGGAGSENNGGAVLLRAPRTGTGAGDGVAVAALDATIEGAAATVLEAVQTYEGVSTLAAGGAGGAGGATLGFDRIGADVADFMAHQGTILAALGKNGDASFHLRPGVEIRSAGDLTLAGDWNLYNASRPGDEPGNLTLRAGGDLILAGSLSDGFAGTAPNAALGDGPSWSYRLAAGANLDGADPLSTAATPDGHFILTPGKLVRTGTGDIDIAAAGDVRLGYDPIAGNYAHPDADASVIYTAGSAGAQIDPALFQLPVSFNGTSLNAYYTSGGGDIGVRAGRDVVSAPSRQLIADWLWRRGEVSASNGTIAQSSGRGLQTTWWVNFAQFRQGIGALGGGDIEVRAGRDVDNLSAVIPTNGRLAGAPGTLPDAANLVVQGGGDLTVLAGRDLNGGLFQVDRGQGLIGAGGSLGAPGSIGSSPLHTLLALADAQIDVRARKDVTLESVLNATILPVASALATSANRNIRPAFFYTYSAASAIDLSSVAGNLTLNNDPGAIKLAASGLVTATYQDSDLVVYPASVHATALSGSLQANGMRLFPAPRGSLHLLAQNDVSLGSLQMYEADPARAANVLRPVITQLRSAGATPIPGGSAEIHLDTVAWPLAPLHRDDPEPIRVVAASGSIFGNSKPIYLPKQAQFIAGQDIRNLRLEGKNLNPGDLTLLQAGRDLHFDINLSPSSNQLLTNVDRIRVGGPGLLQILAGRHVDLGNSGGISTRGATDDARLPARGADIVVAAGLGSEPQGGLREPDYAAFIARYLAPESTHAGEHPAALTAYMKRLTGQDGLTDAQALAAFRALPDPQKLPFVSRVLYAELRTAGLEHNRGEGDEGNEGGDGTGYSRGYDAIATLFPGAGADYAGDINLFFSQIKTEQGGDISLLTPGGSVVVGLTNPPAELAALKATADIPAAASLGIMAFGEGGIRTFAREHITVNRSRILTLQGGDILLWASEGNIDAGRGAKTASAAPPPVIQTDANGNIFVNPSGAVSGSGIGQLLTGGGTAVGSVDLLAPRGIVDAGDAGIRVAGNLNVAAVQVVGADNIRVGGVATGTPVSDSGVLASAAAAGSSVGASVARSTDDFGRDMASSSAGLSNTRDLLPSFIRVEVLGLGE